MGNKALFVALGVWKLATISIAIAFVYTLGTQEKAAPERYPGPDGDVVSVSILSTVDPLRCLASEVVLHDSRGVLYFSPSGACSSFAVMLDAGATLADVEVTTVEPHVLEFGVDKGRSLVETQ